MKKILIGGIVGGIIVFIGGYVFNTVLTLGQMGITYTDAEDKVLAALSSELTEDGIYFMPGINVLEATDEQMEAYAAKYEKGPTAWVVYHAGGEAPVSPKQLITEGLTNIVSALIAALLLSMTAVGYLPRVMFVTLLGAFAFLTCHVPQWTWYRFPADFTAAQLTMRVAAWFVAGLVMAAIVRGKSAGGPAAP